MAETYTDANGLVWLNRGPETDDHLTHGGHETALVRIAKSMLPEGGNFLDVGAHVGLYTLNLADKAANVYAIEANPKTFKALLENVRANESKFSGDIHCVNVAAWDGFDVLELEDANGKETGGSTYCKPVHARKTSVFENNDGTHATALPLDAVQRGPLLDVDLVKIDVEGAEARVLRGMTQTIAAYRPVLFIEMHDKVYDNPRIRVEVLQFLENANYEWNDDLTHGPECYYVIAHPREAEVIDIERVRAGS